MKHTYNLTPETLRSKWAGNAERKLNEISRSIDDALFNGREVVLNISDWSIFDRSEPINWGESQFALNNCLEFARKQASYGHVYVNPSKPVAFTVHMMNAARDIQDYVRRKILKREPTTSPSRDVENMYRRIRINSEVIGQRVEDMRAAESKLDAHIKEISGQ